VCCSVLQSVAVCCSVLQCVAVCCAWRALYACVLTYIQTCIQTNIHVREHIQIVRFHFVTKPYINRALFPKVYSCIFICLYAHSNFQISLCKKALQKQGSLFKIYLWACHQFRDAALSLEPPPPPPCHAPNARATATTEALSCLCVCVCLCTCACAWVCVCVCVCGAWVGGWVGVCGRGCVCGCSCGCVHMRVSNRCVWFYLRYWVPNGRWLPSLGFKDLKWV